MRKYFLTDESGNVWCVKDYGFQVSAFTGKHRAITGMDREMFKRFMKNVIGKGKK